MNDVLRFWALAEHLGNDRFSTNPRARHVQINAVHYPGSGYSCCRGASTLVKPVQCVAVVDVSCSSSLIVNQYGGGGGMAWRGNSQASLCLLGYTV